MIKENKMPVVSQKVTINQPVQTVFDYLTNVANHTAWQAGIQSAAITPPGAPALGSIYSYVTDVMGTKYESKMEVSAFEPNRLWQVKVVGMPNAPITTYNFEEAGGATNMMISMELVGGYPAAAEGAIVAQTQQSLAEQAARIKQQVGG
jgi:uncharacterized membrane protein